METSIKENVLKRRLRGIERYFYRRPNANVLMAARLKGSITVNQLEIALSKVRRRHPLLGARIIQDDQNNAWFTTEGVPELEVQVYPLTSNNDWIHIAVEETSKFFQLDKGPLIRFILLTSHDASEIVINSHHTICDGLSLAYLLRDILLHLGDPDREIEQLPFLPEIGEENLPTSASLSLPQRLGIKFINKIWERKRIFFDGEDYRRLHKTFWKENNHTAILPWELTEAETATLISRCREEKVSVHSALSTAFLLAQSEVQGKAPAYIHNLSMTVNLRDRLIPPVGEALGVYFSSFRIKHKGKQNQSFWSNARKFHKRLKQKLSNKNIFEVQQQLDSLHPSLVDSLYFSKYSLLEEPFADFFLRLEGDDKINTGLDVANLGRLDFPRNYGIVQLEAIYGPSQYVDFQEKYLGVITVGGRMFFSLTFDEAIIERDTVEEIIDVALKHLGKAVVSHVE